MIVWLDHFVDTRVKRSCCVAMITLALMILMLGTYFCLGFVLVSLQEYHDVFRILQRTELTWTYLSRIVVFLVGTASITGKDIVYALFSSLRLWEVLTVCLMMLLPRIDVIAFPKGWRLMKGIVLGCSITAIGVLFYGFQAMTLLRVVYALKLVGYILVFFSISCSMICLYMMFTIVPIYREALSYHVEELEKE